jgi:hypothetical protein
VTLVLDILSEGGLAIRREGLDQLVFRRLEALHAPGSEVAVFAGHAPMLALMEPCTLRARCGGRLEHIDVSAGVVEVLDDHVTILLATPPSLV